MPTYNLLPRATTQDDGYVLNPTALNAGSLWNNINKPVGSETNTNWIKWTGGGSGTFRVQVTGGIEVARVYWVTLRLGIYNANVASASESWQPFVRIGGVNYNYPNVAIANSTSPVIFQFRWTVNPATGNPWQPPDILSMEFGCTNNAAVNGQVTYALSVELNYQSIPADSITPREPMTHRLRRLCHPLEVARIQVPMKFLDVELLSGMQVAHRLGPAASSIGPGWKYKPVPARRPMRLVKREIDLNKMTLTLTLQDRRQVDCLQWETFLTKRSSATEQQGLPRIAGGAGRYFKRATVVNVEDPSDKTIRQIAIDTEAVANGGWLIEDIVFNLVTRSCWADGSFIGWTTVTGGGQAYVMDSTDTIWDKTLTANSAKMTAGAAAHASMSHITADDSANASSANINTEGGCLSVTYKNDNGNRLRWQLQRSDTTNWWRDSDQTWQVSAQDNFFPTASVPTRSRSAKITGIPNVGTTLTIFLLSEVFNQQIHIYDVQLEDKGFSSARIITQGSGAFRDSGGLFFDNSSVDGRQRLFNPARGTLGIAFTPSFNNADPRQGVSRTMGLFSVNFDIWYGGGTPPRNGFEFYWDVDSSSYVLKVWSGGSLVGTCSVLVAGGVVANQEYDVVLRWTGTDGELGLPASSIRSSYMLPGATVLTNGTATTRSADPVQSTMSLITVGAGKPGATLTGAGLPVCSGWFRPDVGLFQDAALTIPAVADGDPVGGWQDQSGLGHHLTQSVGANQPLLRLNKINGFPALDFDGAAKFLTGGLFSQFWGASGLHVFIVWYARSWPTTAGVKRSLFADTGAGFSGFVLYNPNLAQGHNLVGVDSYDGVNPDGVQFRRSSGPGFWVMTEHLYSYIGGQFLYAKMLGDASAAFSYTSGFVNSNTFEVGRGKADSGAAVTYWDGFIAEMLIYKGDAAVSAGKSLPLCQEYFQRKYVLPMVSNPVPPNITPANGLISKFTISQHVLSDEEAARVLFT